MSQVAAHVEGGKHRKVPTSGTTTTMTSSIRMKMRTISNSDFTVKEQRRFETERINSARDNLRADEEQAAEPSAETPNQSNELQIVGTSGSNSAETSGSSSRRADVDISPMSDQSDQDYEDEDDEEDDTDYIDSEEGEMRDQSS